MSEVIGLLLKLALDKQSQQAAEKGMKDTAVSVADVGKSITELTAKEKELTAAIEDQQKKLDAAKNGMDTYARQIEDTQKKLAKYPAKSFLQKDLAAAIENEKRYASIVGEEQSQLESLQSELAATNQKRLDQVDTLKQQKAELAATAKFAGMSSREFSKLSQEEQNAARAAYQAQKNIDKLNKELQETERRINDVRMMGQTISNVSRSIFFGGSAIITSIYALANAEAGRLSESAENINKEKEKARELLVELKKAGGSIDPEMEKWITSQAKVNKTTQDWLDAQERIKESYQRIGAVAQTALLPLLEKAADLAEEVASTIEENPELLKAAVNIGGAMAVIGAAGMVIGQGIIFAADVGKSANLLKQALSVGGMLSKVGSMLPGGAAIAGALSTIAGVMIPYIVTAVVSYLAINTAWKSRLGEKLGNWGQRQLGMEETTQEAGLLAGKQALAVAAAGWGMMFEEVGLAAEGADARFFNFTKTLLKIDEAAEDTDKVAQELEDEAEAARKAEEATARLNAELEGMKAINDLEKDNLEADRELKQKRADINRRANADQEKAADDFKRTSDKITTTLKDTLSKLAADFAQDSLKRDAEFKQQYAEAERDGAEEILQIRKDAQDQLKQLEEDFAIQKDELVRARDALGLVKAQRDFDRQKSEIESNQKEEIAESRRQTKIKLNDMKRSFEQERAERLAKYKQDIIDAKEKAKQDAIDAKDTYDQRRKEIAAQRFADLQDLQRQHNEERRKRILAAYEQIKDLGNALEAERILRQKYYQVFAQEAQNALNAIRPGASTTTTSSGTVIRAGGGGVAGTRQFGGPIGMTGMYLLHKGEHVLSPETTSAAAGLIGGQVSQQAMLMMMAMGRQNSFTMNDGRRFDSSIPASERRAIAAESAETALNIFAGLLAR